MSRIFKALLGCLICVPLALLGAVFAFSGLSKHDVSARNAGWIMLAIAGAVLFWLIRSPRRASPPTSNIASTATVPPDGADAEASPSKARLIFNKQQASTISSLLALCGAYVVWSLVHASSMPTVMACGEPLVIESCEAGVASMPSCQIRNIANVPLGDMQVWGYDANGIRLGSSLAAIGLPGLAPQQAVKVDLVVADSDKAKQIVLCSVDPQTTLGSRRYGVGQRPPLNN